MTRISSQVRYTSERSTNSVTRINPKIRQNRQKVCYSD